MRQKATQRASRPGIGMARKDGSDHQHAWEQVTRKNGDLTDVFDHCHRCGLRSRKGQTQHPSYAGSREAVVA